MPPKGPALAADPLIYCLERLTDYAQFERLCHDLMALDGFKNIEPLGATKDRGRDAIHRDRSTGDVTIFAYSVREDWQKKLADDAAKVDRHGHECDQLVFLSTADFTAGERDKAVHEVQTLYGWKCELYGIERLSNMLRSTHSTLVARHPQIFTPPFFPFAGGLSLATSADHVLLDHIDEDTALAHWLSRRLTLAGYNMWCRGLAPLAGSSVDDTIQGLLEHRAFRYIPILSAASVVDVDWNTRRAAAHALGRRTGRSLVLPAYAEHISAEALDAATRQVDGAHFESSWSTGLRQVLDSLDAEGCPTATGGSDVAVRSYLPENVVLLEPEVLASNLFPVLTLPKVIYRFRSRDELVYGKGADAGTWAFRAVGDREQLSLFPPPADYAMTHRIREEGGTLWTGKREVDGIDTSNLVKELITKGLYALCVEKGLQFTGYPRGAHFVSGMFKNEFLLFNRPDGSRSRFVVTGTRQHTKKAGNFNYYIAPEFAISGGRGEDYSVIVRVRVRIRDLQGERFPKHAANARRKKLCKQWWNKEWLDRTLGVMAFLKQPDGTIRVGRSGNELVVRSTPHTWSAPVRLDEDALAGQPELDPNDLGADVADDDENDDD